MIMIIINTNQWFVISLWIFFICTSKWSLLLALWGQYGHCILLPIPHSALKCLVKVAFELYTRLQFGQMWQPISRLFSFGFEGGQGSSVSWFPSGVLFPNIIWPLAPTIRYSPKNVNSKLKMKYKEKKNKEKKIPGTLNWGREWVRGKKSEKKFFYY